MKLIVAAALVMTIVSIIRATAAEQPAPASAPAPAPRLPADLKPLLDYPMRDTCVCLGPDGTYYLTGTTGHPAWWVTNEGIRMWKSKDLKNWEPMGLVWSFEKDATWQKGKTEKDGRFAGPSGRRRSTTLRATSTSPTA